MKTIKNKEIIIGLLGLIVLSVVAIALIIRREFPAGQSMDNQTMIEEIKIEKEQEELLSQTESVTDKGETVKDQIQLEVTPQNKEESSAKGDKTLTNAEAGAEMNKLALNKFADNQNEFYTAPVYLEYTGEELSQLEELYYYWNDYKLDAVDDLIRLPRLRTAFTNELTGTNGFYYYGTLDKNGQPSGSGVAVYENNTYYCGEWKNGKRHGKGMWLQIYPDKPATINGVKGIVEHSYNGQWQDDLPNGEGQEHIEYDMEAVEGNAELIANVIGNFKDGYYDGELYIMVIDDEGGSQDWEATAQKGTFTYYHERLNASNNLPVWKKMTDSTEDEFYWMSKKDNVNWGIFGLKK